MECDAEPGAPVLRATAGTVAGATVAADGPAEPAVRPPAGSTRTGAGGGAPGPVARRTTGRCPPPECPAGRANPCITPAGASELTEWPSPRPRPSVWSCHEARP